MLKKGYLLMLISLFGWAQNNQNLKLFSTSLQEIDYEEEFFCDACGCSASGGAMGFSSLLTQQFVGIRYLQQNYRVKENIHNNSPWSQEQFNTMQIWARIPINKKIQILTLIPVHQHTQEKQTGTKTIKGLGDVTIMGLYSIFKTKSDSLSWKHHVQLGGGIKAPTGEYQKVNPNLSVNPSFQVGTGSWDYLVLSEYILQYKKWGLQTTYSYNLKTENQNKYQFGNQINYSISAFHSFEKKWGVIIPQVGVAGEHYKNNREFGIVQPGTKGEVLFGRIAAEVAIKKWHLGLQWFSPINQNLTDGDVEAQNRWSVNINYAL